MKLNQLYRFITDELNSKTNYGVINNRFLFKKNLSSMNYSLYAFDNILQPEVITPSDIKYRLTAHHVSFYEYQDKKNPCLSQYHYTAYFSDVEQKEYQLHVYFDEQDNVTMNVQLSLKLENGNYVLQSVSSSDSEYFIQFASNQTVVFIKELRKMYEQKVKLLQGTYTAEVMKLEEQSLNLHDNLLAYSQQIDVVINCLSPLLTYSSDKKYVNLLKLFKNTKKALQDCEFITEQTDESEECEISSSSFLEFKTQTVKPQKTIKPSITALVDNMLELEINYVTLPKDVGDQMKMQTFLKYLDAVNMIVVTEDDYVHSMEASQKIQFSYTKCMREANNFLANLLLKNSFELANSLKSMVNSIAPQFVRIALFAGDAQLLDYVLTNASIPINSFVICDNLSPVVFCMLKHNKPKSQVDCLSVLIKHKANLMVEGVDGLPLIHPVVLSINHPLRKALSDNVSLTIGNKSFYKQLISALKNLPPHFTKEQRTFASFALEAYVHSLQFLNKHKLEATNIRLTNTEIQLQELNEYVKTLPLKFLKRDLDFQEKQKDLTFAYQNYINKLSNIELRQVSRNNSHALETLNEHLKTIDLSAVDIKAAAMNTISDLITILDHASILHDIQTELKKPVFSKNGRPTKRQNQLAVKEKQIVKDIAPLQSKYNFLSEAFPKPDLDSVSNILSELMSVTKQVQELFTTIKVVSNKQGFFIRVEPEAEKEEIDKSVDITEKDSVEKNETMFM